jgi:signal transduction histidine kinase
LRNPLHALALHLALARATSKDPDVAERVRRAESTLKRYSERVTVLMELLARPGAVYPLSPRPVDVGGLLQALAESLDQEARSRRIDVRVEIQPRPDGWRRSIDAVAFEQAVDNLLLNAFKHSTASAVTIRLRAEPGSWVVQVEDNGSGIAAQDQVEIFEKFGVASHSSRGSGTGLGLWIVARLVQAMRGEISLDSAPGEGCRFTLRIPERNEMSTKP